MKIVVTGTRGVPRIMGGVETHCENLFPIISSFGGDVTVLRRSSYVKDDLTEWKGLELVNIPSPRKKALEAIVHTFRAVNWAARHKVDILHINAIGPALVIPYAKIRGLKVVFTHHGPDYDRDKWGVLAKTALHLGERFGSKYADEVIVISRVIEESVKAKYGRTDHIHLIPNGVPAPDICDYPGYFRELGIETGKFVLGMSRFVPEKRLEDIVYAFAKTDLSKQGYKLVLAGDADFEDNYSLGLKSLAKKSDVILTGFVSGKKLHSLLSCAALYVLPSSHEGLPIALLEAMSYRLPVLASNIPANLEVGLGDDSYFELGNIDQLSEKMAFAINQGHKEYNMSRYDWEKIAEETFRIYREICS